MTMMAAMVSAKEIPHDVETEILERLPVKSLLRFKCVCKDWYSLIISLGFVEKHYDTNKTKQAIIYNSAIPVVRFFGAIADYTIPSSIPYPRMIGCSKGLVCLSRMVGNSWVSVLWNPGTRQCREIGNAYRYQDSNKYYHGFCFDNVGNSFKVTQIGFSWRQDGRFIARLGTFSLNDNFWKMRRTKETGYPSTNFLSHEVVRVDRWMYWIMRDRKECGELVLCYDMVNEVFQRIEPPCPDLSYAARNPSHLVPYKNTVAFILPSEFDPLFDSFSFQLWVMNGSASGNPSWSKPLTYKPVVGVDKICRVVGFYSDADDVNLVVLSKDGNYWMFNLLHTNTTAECIGQSHGCAGVFQYSESLASIN